MQISKMEMSDLDSIADYLLYDFDDFWSYNVFKSELENENSRYIVAKENNEILGFAGIWIAVDVAHVTNIVTAKSHRNQGIGNLLLESLINLCYELDLTSITLEVNEKNLPAIKLYEKFGFENLRFQKKLLQWD